MARALTRNLRDIIDTQLIVRNVKAVTVSYSKQGPGQAGARCVSAVVLDCVRACLCACAVR